MNNLSRTRMVAGRGEESATEARSRSRRPFRLLHYSSTPLLLLLSLLFLPSLLHAQEQGDDEDKPLGYIGLFGGIGFNAFDISLDPLWLAGGQPAPSDPLFNEGGGIGLTAGILLEFPVSGPIGFGARLAWQNRGGDMSAVYENRTDVATPGGTPRPANVNIDVDNKLAYLSLTPHLKVMPESLPVYFFAGPSIMVPFDMTYKYTEAIQESGLVFTNIGGPTRTRIANGSIPETPIKLAANLGLGLEIFVSDRSAILFDVQHSFMIGDLSSGLSSDDTWRSDMTSLTLGFKTGFGSRGDDDVPPPPPPVATRDTMAVKDTVERVRAGVVRDGGLSDTLLVSDERVKQTEVHALLPYVFFERDSATIPARYHQLDRRAVSRWREETIDRGSTIDVYYHLLNIIGSRLRKYRSVKLTITGHVGKFESNDSTLALRRAEAVRDYLMDTWRIREDQMIIKAGGLPQNPSNSEVDSLEGDVENRRVEFHASDLSFLAPVKLPDTLLLQPTGIIRLIAPPSDLPDSIAELESWTVNVRVGDSLIKKTGYGKVPENIDIPIESRPDLNRRGPVEITSELVILDSNYNQRKSLEGTPVWFVEEGKYQVERNVENGKFVDRYNLLLYSFDSAGIFDFSQQTSSIFRERIRPESTVEIIGHTDRIGLPYYNKRLSLRRAEVASNIIGINNAKISGAGESDLPYDNTLPEGRYYSRTVTVIITTPISASDTLELPTTPSGSVDEEEGSSISLPPDETERDAPPEGVPTSSTLPDEDN